MNVQYDLHMENLQMTNPSIDIDSINTIRFLSADAIEKAQSGHPGLPMGAAPAGYVLWTKILQHNPGNPRWINRDRFVLSAGHGSMLLYSLLHLTGYERPTVEDIQQFRQWLSCTPGHPENTLLQGVEVTTGPLGQGLGNAVGFACAERHLASRFNRPDCEIIDHATYCLVGDGCLMEGISSEAASLAGHLGLGKLIVLYDDNKISIDGSTSLTFTEDVTGRFESFGWQVLEVRDGDTDVNGIEAALRTARAELCRPTLIRIHTTIGYGCPSKAGTADCHGAPLGDSHLQATRDHLGWKHGPFEIPHDVRLHMRKVRDNGQSLEDEWNQRLSRYAELYPEDHAVFAQQISEDLPAGWESALPRYEDDAQPMATRAHSGIVLNNLAAHFKGLFGGSADLSPSNQTLIHGSGDFQRDAYDHQNLRFGVREHAMGAICNGIALHGSGMIPYCASFLAFADYMRNAIRMSSLSQAGVIYIFTHDSVAVGEDGPTHQPVEHIASLRLIPGLMVIRPADGNEVSGAYQVAIQNRNRPTVLVLTRQNVPPVPGTDPDRVRLGAYIVCDCDGTPDLLLIGTGSEVSICVQAAARMAEDGIKARVISMPSWELFEIQPATYREQVLPDVIEKRLAVEAGSAFGWSRYIGRKGDSISIADFGHSAPGHICMKNRGYTVENVIARSRKLLDEN